jgi:hypothetical protein
MQDDFCAASPIRGLLRSPEKPTSAIHASPQLRASRAALSASKGLGGSKKSERVDLDESYVDDFEADNAPVLTFM